VLHVPEGLDLAKAGPLLCAGATTYSPLRTWNIGPGSRVGVIGMGGLGHMAIKLAAALGASVTVLSRSPGKEKDATD
ncbi:NAD(P)-dependent alcohol dehydrogenase, partial [Curtobacterium sp. C2H10]